MSPRIVDVEEDNLKFITFQEIEARKYDDNFSSQNVFNPGFWILGWVRRVMDFCVKSWFQICFLIMDMDN